MNSSKIEVVPGIYESLFDARHRDLWPEEIIINNELKKELGTRRNLINILEKIFAIQLNAEVELTFAMDIGFIKPDEAAELYSQLAEFLNINPRLVLYLPFELIPHKDWKTDSMLLSEAIRNFHSNYISCWNSLLGSHDVRASFLDGDILEKVSYEDLPKVVKAAHLAWVLVKKGLITPAQVISLIEISKDKVLRQSLSDSVKVMLDLCLLGPNTLAKSKDPLIIDLLTSWKNSFNSEDQFNQKFLLRLNDLRMLVASMRNESDLLDQSLNSLKGKISEGRIKWLCQKDRHAILKKYAERVSNSLFAQTLSLEDFEDFMSESLKDSFSAKLVIESITQYMETLGQNGLSPQYVYRRISPRLKILKYLKDSEVNCVIKSMNYRLSYWGIIGGQEFNKHNFASQKEIGKLKEMIGTICSDEKFSALYPMILVYGSRAKGYSQSTDFDLAVMVRPNTNFDSREILKKSLSKLAMEKGIEATFLDFWLEENKGSLAIKNFQNPNKFLGGIDFAHVLFEAVWIGKPNTIRQVFENLISGFLLSKKLDQPIKDLILSEIERNTLQYRLMHKGYAYMYPPQGGIDTRNSAGIDSKSSFWDSGYRRLATKLFIKKVFLP